MKNSFSLFYKTTKMILLASTDPENMRQDGELMIMKIIGDKTLCIRQTAGHPVATSIVSS